MPNKSGPKKLTSAERADRDRKMFIAWMGSRSMDEVAKQFGLNVRYVRDVSRKYDWRSARAEVLRRGLIDAMDDVRSVLVGAIKGLQRDLQLMLLAAEKESRQLTKEERDHARALFDRFAKEVRLEDGKPTDTGAGGTLTVELRLPEGVKGFGIIPPDPSVKLIEHKAKATKPTIDVAAVLAEMEEDDK